MLFLVVLVETVLEENLIRQCFSIFGLPKYKPFSLLFTQTYHKSGLPNFFFVVSWAVFVDMSMCHVWYTNIFPEIVVFTVTHRSVNMILLNFLMYFW